MDAAHSPSDKSLELRPLAIATRSESSGDAGNVCIESTVRNPMFRPSGHSQLPDSDEAEVEVELYRKGSHHDASGEMEVREDSGRLSRIKGRMKELGVSAKVYFNRKFFDPSIPPEAQIFRNENVCIVLCYVLVGILEGVSSGIMNGSS